MKGMVVDMENKPDQVAFTGSDGKEVIFEVLEQTRLGGVDYLLVSRLEEEGGEAEALILKDRSKDTDEEAVYDIVEDEEELQSVAAIFRELLGDEIELY